MADYTTTSNIVLQVNGKQAQQMLSNLQKDAQALERKIEAAAKAGDKVALKKLQRELNATNRIIQQIQGSSVSAEQVLRRLDSASPRELKKTLQTLQRQLNGIQRGTAAWDAHVAKIRAVKAELAKVNASMGESTSKMRGFFSGISSSVLGLTASFSGLLMVGKKAVEDFAKLDQEMANVRKFTGLSAAQVETLNERFKEIDTRSSREQLNILAQEAGRLGKTSEEDILGFVRAADKINVALDDLGDGATLTLSKLTGIFGDEARYGTEQSLLKVGSVINELSQNCSASAPYLANFAERMGGVGAQAKMTIPQIMGFAAVLDSNSQQVEASATALSQVLVRLYQDPANYAKVAGLDVQQFTTLLRRDANAALLQFLGALQQAGGMDVLSPMFKDMGENGSRAIQALSTLAVHIDDVKRQQEAANEAFNEGTSIDAEFAVQNSTVQAELEKSKNRVHELTVELGQKLYPVFKHLHTSSAVAISAFSAFVDFIIRFKNVLVPLTSAVVAYYTAIGIARAKTAALNAVTAVSTALQNAYNYSLGLGKVAVIAFTKGLGEAKVAFKALNATMSMNPFGVILAAIAAVVAAVKLLEKEMTEYEKIVAKTKNAVAGFSKESIEERHELDLLFGTLRGAAEGTDSYNAAKNKLISKYGRYLQGLINERGEIANLTEAYDRLALAIRRSNAERALNEGESANDAQYMADQSALLGKLRENIEYWTGDAVEAAELSAKVAEALASNGELDAETSRRLAQISQQILPTGQGAWESIKASSRFSANGIIADWFGLMDSQQSYQTPNEILGKLIQAREQHGRATEAFDAMRNSVSPYRNQTEEELTQAISNLCKMISGGNDATIALPNRGGVGTSEQTLTVAAAETILQEIRDELTYRNASAPVVAQPEVDASTTPGTIGQTSSIAESKAEKRERLARERAERAAKRALKESLREQQRVRDEALAENERQRQRSEDPISEAEYLQKKDELNLQFLADSKRVLEERGYTETAEYAALLRKEEEITAAAAERMKRTVLKALKTQYTTDSAENESAYRNGDVDYATYIAEKERLDLKYVDESLEIYRQHNQTETQDYANMLERRETLLLQHKERELQIEREGIESRHALRLADIENEYYTPGSASFMDSAKYDEAVFNELKRYLEEKRDTYLEGSQEWRRIDDQIADAERKRASDQSKKYADTYKRLMSKESLKSEYEQQLSMLDSVYQHELELAEGNEERKAALAKAYHIARAALAEQYGEAEGNAMKKAVQKSVEWLKSDAGQAMTGTLSTLASGLSDIMSGVTSMVQANMEIQIAGINKRYEAEVSAAEGNAYQVAKLEKDKEREVAAAKEEANKKMFAMQVIQAVAQTAQGAISAYSSAAAIPVVGWIMAPIAAAMALAAGAIQIAAIKKQQQASAAQGYSEGGFTPEGGVHEPVGVVHAGEWVASQKLTRNPKTRPLLEALEQAQRNNTIGSISPEDVSNSILAPIRIASASASSQQPNVIVNMPEKKDDGALTAAVEKLNRRLEKPIGAVVTVTGDNGIKQAQDEYTKLLNNKNPKY